MVTTLEDFIREFTYLRREGWLPTHHPGPLGVSQTLGELLGLPADRPSFGEYALKCCRKHSAGTVTLFTKAPQPRSSNQLLLEKFGYASSSREQALHASLTATRFTDVGPAGHTLKLAFDESRLFLVSDAGREEVYWGKDKLEKAFRKKFHDQFIYVNAETRSSGVEEQFWYSEAWLISGFSFHAMLELFREGRILVDLRIGQYPDGRIHDHGTAFRMAATDQPLLFSNRKQIV